MAYQIVSLISIVKNRPKTPRNSIAAQLYLDMKKRGNNSWFVKCGPGVFGLKEWKTKLDD